MTAYERSIGLAIAQNEFRFDKNHFHILDDKTLARENNDFASLWPTLGYTAQLYLQLKDLNQAWKYATMGVSIGQQLKRCKGYYDAAQIDAGDVDCRLVRANILMSRGQLKAALSEINQARILAAVSGYSGWQKRIKAADLRLASLRIKPEKK